MTGAELLAWGDLFAPLIPLAADLLGALRRLVSGEDPSELVEEYARRTATLIEEVVAARSQADLLRMELAAQAIEASARDALAGAERTLAVTEESLTAFLNDTAHSHAAGCRDGCAVVHEEASREAAAGLLAAAHMTWKLDPLQPRPLTRAFRRIR